MVLYSLLIYVVHTLPHATVLFSFTNVPFTTAYPKTSVYVSLYLVFALFCILYSYARIVLVRLALLSKVPWLDVELCMWSPSNGFDRLGYGSPYPILLGYRKNQIYGDHSYQDWIGKVRFRWTLSSLSFCSNDPRGSIPKGPRNFCTCKWDVVMKRCST